MPMASSEIEPSPDHCPAPVDFEANFAPFLRHDVYGRFGRGDLPWPEKVLIALSLFTVVPFRIAVCAGMLLFYYFVCKACTLFQPPNRDGAAREDFAHMHGWRRAVIVNFGKKFSRIFLFVLGFYRINVIDVQLPSNRNSTGEEGGRDHGRPGAIISNHISYIDILYHISSSFPSFVSKKSVANFPVVGLMSKCLGCIYVKQDATLFDKGISGTVAKRIREAHQNEDVPQLMIFPEGTTTSGNFLLPFKTGAFLSKAPVHPMILRYPYDRFSIAWDSISWERHALFLLCQFVNHMEVIRLPVYYPSTEEMDNPQLYAKNVRELMAAQGKLELSELGMQEKRAYLSALEGLYKQA